MDNTLSECSAVRYRVFKGLRETTKGAWEADALPTELFPLNNFSYWTSLSVQMGVHPEPVQRSNNNTQRVRPGSERSGRSWSLQRVLGAHQSAPPRSHAARATSRPYGDARTETGHESGDKPRARTDDHVVKETGEHRPGGLQTQISRFKYRPTFPIWQEMDLATGDRHGGMPREFPSLFASHGPPVGR